MTKSLLFLKKISLNIKFNCLPKNLIIAKWHSCGYEKASLRPMDNYLTDRYQGVKINNSCSLRRLSKYGVIQGSVLGSVLYTIFLCNMFFMIDTVDVANYAHYSTPCVVPRKQCELETKLQQVSVKLFQQFHENGMKANKDKCHFLSSLDIKKFATSLHTRKFKLSKTFWCSNWQ